jgi:hypothetical protein
LKFSRVKLQTGDYENLVKSSPIPLTTGGDLIDAFNVGGQHAVEELIRDQFGVFMYKGGKGQVINRAEYLRWKYMENAEVFICIAAPIDVLDLFF